jgi:hypothetical protein
MSTRVDLVANVTRSILQAYEKDPEEAIRLIGDFIRTTYQSKEKKKNVSVPKNKKRSRYEEDDEEEDDFMEVDSFDEEDDEDEVYEDPDQEALDLFYDKFPMELCLEFLRKNPWFKKRFQNRIDAVIEGSGLGNPKVRSF